MSTNMRVLLGIYPRLFFESCNKFIFTCQRRGLRLSPGLYRIDYRPQNKFSKSKSPASIVREARKQAMDDTDVIEKDEDDENEALDNYIDKTLHISEFGHQVAVIQPYIKWGKDKRTLTTPQLQLEEAVTLIKTLRNWKVCDQMTISLMSFKRQSLFGPGQLEVLKERILGGKKISAIFISLNMLKARQYEYLHNYFGLPIYDRYTIVINIFREHATTIEAKLQIKLAELPYLKSRLKHIEGGGLDTFGGGAAAIGTTWKGKEFHDQLFKRREARIKEQIERLKLHRKTLRKTRLKNEIPIVAVVGYTNSGKTSLIKAVTGREKLEPQDYLFATLDVTVHMGKLPSSMEVLFVDTIGFMSDIPTKLIQSFVATLEDALIADVIIHVRDVSHPDTVWQNENVMQTLKSLDVPESVSNNIITVGNKIDLLSDEECEKYRSDDMVLISAKNMIGTDYLLQKVENIIFNCTNRNVITMKVRCGGEEYSWLHENVTVINETACADNNQYSYLKVIITDIALAKFKHIFIKEYFKSRKQG